jgi:4-amino-4-deoxy-L-arabinose transferase-like glycosyltransferase
LTIRVGFALIADPPLLYTHQYNYYTGALRLAEHPHPVGYALHSDQWRTWASGTTIAPLYYLVLGAFFRVFGPGLLGLRLFQGALDALVAVAVASLGRRLVGPWGLGAGVAYAFQWSAVEMTCWTMTENLHTVLLVGGLAILAAEAEAPSRGLVQAFGGGFLIGLSGLTRSVSSAFVPLAMLWRWSLGGWSRARSRAVLLPAVLVLAGGLFAILPWAARNVFLMRRNVAIETVGFFNLWDDNAAALVSKDRYDRQLGTIRAQATPAAAGNLSLLFTARNIAGNPGGFVRKTVGNFWHFVRPELLNNFLMKEYPDDAWRNVVAFVTDDLMLLLALPPFVAFLLGGRPSPTRRLLTWWTAYYGIMVFVVFHTESRYRSPLVPVVLAGAAAGIAALAGERSRQKARAWAGLVAGLLVSIWTTWPYVGPAWSALAAQRALVPARLAIESGDLGAAEGLAEAAAAKAPRSPRPWLTYASWLAVHDHPAEAAVAVKRAAALAGSENWAPVAALPALLRAAGRDEDAVAALRAADRLSWDLDPWLMLEAAWRDLPAPRTDEIRLAGGDYGAVRGFLYPRGIDPTLFSHRREWNDYPKLGGPQPPPGPHRWSRGRSWLRLQPGEAAPAYRVTLTMGSPFPSPLDHPVVFVRVNDGPVTRFVLTPELRDYDLTARIPPGATIVVRLDAPTWGRAGEPADQGVRVDALRVAPVGGGEH